MIIEKIDSYDKKRDKVLTDEGLVLLLYKGEIRKLRFQEGMEISDEFYRGTVLPILVKRARERLVYILKNSDKPEAEIRRKYKEGFYPDEAAEAAIEWGKLHHYIDDARYTDNYIRYHSEGKSARKIMYDLMAKGISKELIEQYLDMAEIDEKSQVTAELRKRHFDPEDADPAVRRKIAAALMRKGYSWDTVRSCMNLYED